MLQPQAQESSEGRWSDALAASGPAAVADDPCPGADGP